jgi:hypothetical protein
VLFRSLSLAEPDGELLTGLTELKLGPGARFDITNDDVSLKALETLFLGDGSYLSVPGTNVTFKEDTPLALTLGKNVAYSVGMSPSAKLNTVIAKDASLVSSSTLTVYPGSTFTVNEGVTFTVEGSSTFDIGKLPIPTADETPLVTINGTIEIADGSSFVGLDAQANPANLYKTLTLGADGKVLLDYGAFFYFGATGQKFVGDNGDSATYEWATAPDDGAQIEINQGGLIIRDTDSIDTPVAIGVAAEGAAILKDQSLYLDRGVSLTIASGFNLSLFGDIDTNGGGAKLLGPGKVITGTDIAITGGDYGWQAIGDNINIGNGTASLQSISSAIPASATVSATLKALGLGAVIDIADGETLEIKADLTVDLNGSNLRKAGEIVLGNASVIELEEADSVILTGANPAGHATAAALADDYTSEVDGGTFNAIGVAELGGDGTYALAVTTAAPNVTDNKLPSGKLYSLTGTSGNAGTVTASSSGASISSETVTVADNT